MAAPLTVVARLAGQCRRRLSSRYAASTAAVESCRAVAIAIGYADAAVHVSVRSPCHTMLGSDAASTTGRRGLTAHHEPRVACQACRQPTASMVRLGRVRVRQYTLGPREISGDSKPACYSAVWARF